MSNEELIELLKKMSKNAHECAKSCKWNSIAYHSRMHECLTYDTVIYILTDANYRDTIKKIYED